MSSGDIPIPLSLIIILKAMKYKVSPLKLEFETFETSNSYLTDELKLDDIYYLLFSLDSLHSFITESLIIS